MKYAVIDIGSNSVRLMLWADGTLYKKLFTTRLAAGMQDGFLAEDAMERTADAVCACYVEGVREAGAPQVFLFATAAVRSARNAEVFCGRVFSRCGARIDVVSGETEALLGALGSMGYGDGSVIDIGGASTEVFSRRGGRCVFSVSLPLGAVRLKDCCGQDAAKMIEAIAAATSPLAVGEAARPVYAVGGTACTLACLMRGAAYRKALVHGVGIPRAWLEQEAALLLSLSTEERKRLAGMEEKRADVIAGGAMLLLHVMDRLGLEEVTFSDEDNMEGYLRYKGLI